ncbi:collagen-binding domain-containing protein [Lactiplantibacillus paraplantarum]|uniref:Cell surface protein n=1 Tax=Lactiplantibacillus paraplantarum TaxID=60520 RepID=A0AAD0TS14_9LACO|nr:collagen-binding domain-containing protein [Lactiplantibacillus paraplantarum]AVW11174.1 cell surface protein [Lactiplantibacillus paraplantarum]AYJ39587.1 cell surface protein [Lactiplantibacillus paraplantarum]ERL43804.1 cell surface protein [Lactiplantibacillus paraplantarum]MCU4684654.1 KxYKxGKxW signal peptide domain-containing protein [Lactiplantibacillus paraplantarum]MDL2063037.1 KxYKxGKxW signal peptide domain-containing protein [Lactiplantibacillus paraplantarum]
MERKRTHFKMYKIGRRWAFACAVILTLGTTTLAAKADDGAAEATTDSTSTSSTTTKSVTAKTQTLKSSTTKRSSQASTDTASQNQSALDADDTGSSTASSVANSTVTADADSNSAKNASTTSQSNEANSTVTTSESTKSTATTSDDNGSKTTANTVTDTASDQSATTSATVDASTEQKNTNKVTAQATTVSTSAAVAKTAATTTNKVASPQTAAMALTQAVTQTNDAVADGGNVTDDYPDLHNMLGISSQFHIFAREAELHAHTNGNVAVQNLVGNVNFGTNIIEELLDKDISYIQNISNIAGSSFVSAGETRSNKVIFGENIDIDVSNPNRPMVNGVYIDHLLASEVYQDKAGNVYIDFDEEFAKLEKLSTSLSEQPADVTYTSDSFEDMNQRVIDVTDMQPDANGHIVINLSADVLNTSTPLTIKGLSADADGNTVIINVDTAGAATYQVNSQIKIIYDDGTERNNKETEDFGDNHLLWNFYDSTATDRLASGVISVERPFQGSILAPAAEIDANQNIDGNLIANKVNVRAETHRWDLQDNVDNENDPEPGDNGNGEEPGDNGNGEEPGDNGNGEEPGDNGNGEEPEPDYDKPVPPTIDVEMPGDGDGDDEDEPEYEKPVHPSIDIEMPSDGDDEDEPEYEKPVHPSIDVEMPSDGDDEDEPEYEKPVHPIIDVVEMPSAGDDEDESEYEKPVHPSIDIEMPDFDDIEDEAEAEEAEEEFEDAIEDEIEAGVTPDEVVDQIEEEVKNEITADWVTDETVTELETAFEEVQKEAVVGNQIKDEASLLNLIDQAIVRAKAHHNTALVAQLQALRTKVAAALAVAQGQSLPQTSEGADQMISLAGIALASTLVLGATAVSRRKRQN